MAGEPQHHQKPASSKQAPEGSRTPDGPKPWLELDLSPAGKTRTRYYLEQSVHLLAAYQDLLEVVLDPHRHAVRSPAALRDGEW